MKGLKKIIALGFITVVAAASSFAVDVQMRLLPTYSLQTRYKNAYILGGTLALDLNVFTLRGRDDIFFTIQGNPDYLAVKNVNPAFFYNIHAGTGYNFRLNDRIGISGELLGGFWTFPVNKGFNSSSFSGISFGGRVSGNYYLLSYLEASVFAGYKCLYSNPEPYMNKIEFGVGLTYNFTKGLFSRSEVDLIAENVDPLFPVFYSRYDNNSFGTLVFKNNEKNNISNVIVSIYIEQFMTVPKTVATYEKVKIGEEFSADLTAFLSETMLNQLQGQLSNAVVTVSYNNLGTTTSVSHNISLQTLTRNSMSWEDDRRAAAFVSSKDGAVQRFARRISLALKDKLTAYPNMQYAEAVFNVLKAYGINYVIDPSSAFTDNIGTAAIDFLQFPYQTLLYHGGDCDDLSILNCALLEALGVPTAFITIPGHIYMAFDSGVPLELADSKIGKGKYIAQNNKAWIPVEITVSQDTYRLALNLGIRQWNKYPDEGVLIPLEEAWLEYKPVSIPESDVTVQFPKNALK